MSIVNAYARAQEIRDLLQHYNRSEQASDPVAVATRIALSEYAEMLPHYANMRDGLCDMLADMLKGR